jgi:hypothetical protein
VRGIYGRLVTAGDIVQEHLRFAYCFEDPNTAAYFFLIAISPFLMTGKITRPVWLLLILTTVAVLASQSKGGLIAFVLMLVAAGYRSDEGLRLFLSPRMLVLLSGIALALLLLYSSLDRSLDRSADSNRFFAYAIDRLLGDRDIYLQGGSRFQIWSGVLDSLLPYPLGRGYMLLNNREILFPHSDLLRVVFSYGLIALVATLWFFFGRALRFAPLTIPAAMAFFINTLIDEQKLLALFLTLLALCVASSDRRVAALRTPGPS